MNTFKTMLLTKTQVFSIALSSIFINNLSALPFITTLDDCNSLYKSQKYSEYIDSCADYAKEDITTEWNFSQIYAVGAVGIKNPQLAVFYAEEPAKAGLVDAIRLMCDSYGHGAGVKLDYERTFWWCSKGNQQNDDFSTLTLAYLYQNGFGTAININRAIGLYNIVANKNNYYTNYAQNQLALIYLNQTPANFNDGFYWLKKSYSNKNTFASSLVDQLQNKYPECNLKTRYFDSDLSFTEATQDCTALQTTNQDYSAIGSKLFNEKNYVEAFQLYTKAANQGNAGAQVMLGSMYATGKGTTQNYQQAFQWFTKAANQGNADAQKMLGYMYYNGQGTTRNYQQAFQWFTKAANQGNADAQGMLGMLYYFGHGTTQNYNLALQWLTKAANQGNARAQAVLGMMYHRGQGTTQNYNLAFQWYTEAANQGNASAQNNLGWCYEIGYGAHQDYTLALFWYKKAADQGNPAGQGGIGDLYRDGHGVEKNYTIAISWYTKSANNGFPEAQYNLGNMYLTGKGVVKDGRKACEWIKKSAANGFAKANEQLTTYCK